VLATLKRDDLVQYFRVHVFLLLDSTLICFDSTFWLDYTLKLYCAAIFSARGIDVCSLTHHVAVDIDSYYVLRVTLSCLWCVGPICRVVSSSQLLRSIVEISCLQKIRNAALFYVIGLNIANIQFLILSHIVCNVLVHLLLFVFYITSALICYFYAIQLMRTLLTTDKRKSHRLC